MCVTDGGIKGDFYLSWDAALQPLKQLQILMRPNWEPGSLRHSELISRSHLMAWHG